MKVSYNCYLEGGLLSDLGLPTQNILAETTFDLRDICCITEVLDTDTQEINPDCAYVEFKSGLSFRVEVNYLKLKKAYLCVK